MFSVQMDTTQNVSVQDQCPLIIRYVNFSGVHEKLLSILTMIETKGKSFHEMLYNKLLSNGLGIRNCIGDSTDGGGPQICKVSKIGFLHVLLNHYQNK